MNFEPAERKRMIRKAAYMIFHEGKMQKDVAKELGVSKNTMTTWVREMREQNMDVAGSYNDSASAFMVYMMRKNPKLYREMETAYGQYLKQL